MTSAVKPTNVARVSMLLRSNLLMDSVRSNSVDLLKVQNQLSTGLKIARPSEDPGAATSIMNLDSLIERYKQYQTNIGQAKDYMDQTDSALSQSIKLVGNAHTQALDALSVASRSGGIVDFDSYIPIIDGIIQSMVSQGNSVCRGSYIFGGQNNTVPPFEQTNGGVLFRGNLSELEARVSAETQQGFTVNGQEVFGALSSQVMGIEDLNPDITAATPLSDLNGALQEGIRKGSIIVSDGTNSVTVDLSLCVTVGDVINKINTAASAATLPADRVKVTAAISADGTSLSLTPTVPAGNITVNEVGTGYTARDLGIHLTVGGGAGVLLAGQDVDARLSLTTPVTALHGVGGAGIDTINGLIITNGQTSKTIDLSTATTLDDILNAINHAGLSVRAEINNAGTGINVLNQLSGSEMTIGENGGTSATDLGIRSLTLSTLLADTHAGAGLHNANAIIRITDSSGASANVDISTATTMKELIDLINNTVGINVTAGLAAVGNGLAIKDDAAGAGTLSINMVQEDNYHILDQLGFAVGNRSVATGGTLKGNDINPIMPDGVFSHLIALRDALTHNSTTEVSAAGALLEADHTNLIKMQGIIGSKTQSLTTRKEHTEENLLAANTLRSDIRDVDFTEAITRYQNLYTALQGNLKTGSQMVNISLLDFLS